METDKETNQSDYWVCSCKKNYIHKFKNDKKLPHIDIIEKAEDCPICGEHSLFCKYPSMEEILSGENLYEENNKVKEFNITLSISYTRKVKAINREVAIIISKETEDFLDYYWTPSKKITKASQTTSAKPEILTVDKK